MGVSFEDYAATYTPLVYDFDTNRFIFYRMTKCRNDCMMYNKEKYSEEYALDIVTNGSSVIYMPRNNNIFIYDDTVFYDTIDFNMSDQTIMEHLYKLSQKIFKSSMSYIVVNKINMYNLPICSDLIINLKDLAENKDIINDTVMSSKNLNILIDTDNGVFKFNIRSITYSVKFNDITVDEDVYTSNVPMHLFERIRILAFLLLFKDSLTYELDLSIISSLKMYDKNNPIPNVSNNLFKEKISEFRLAIMSDLTDKILNKLTSKLGKDEIEYIFDKIIQDKLRITHIGVVEIGGIKMLSFCSNTSTYIYHNNNFALFYKKGCI